MKTFTVVIECENAAFEDDPHSEVARLLKDAARRFELGADVGPLIDSNGNCVGSFYLEN